MIGVIYCNPELFAIDDLFPLFFLGYLIGNKLLPSPLLHAHRTHPCAHSTHGPPCTRPTINMPFRQGFAANVLRTLGGALVLVGYDEIKRIIG